MVRVMLKGVHKCRKRLANGKTVEYHYAWRGGCQPPGFAGVEKW